MSFFAKSLVTDMMDSQVVSVVGSRMVAGSMLSGEALDVAGMSIEGRLSLLLIRARKRWRFMRKLTVI